MEETVTKVWIDDECISCEACIAVCPEVLDMDGDKCVVKSEAADNAEVLKENSESIIQAAEECPVEAIKYETE